MIIGGVDVVLRVERTVPITDVVLRIARRLWPRCVFQDADQPQILDNDDLTVWLFGTASREFFIYRDRQAANAWSQVGGTPENQNAMLHFLISGSLPGDNARRELTVVVGGLSEQMVSFIDDLKHAVGCVEPFRRSHTGG